ncbi:MAG: hypothetical protein M3Z20_00820 [Chloroflexota bacterium]|nr:hypothetical protein [Chloroflexota bacterium]
MTQQQYLHLPRALPHFHPASALRLLALLGLFLLPIQMRAGTGYVHPHALVHLLLDAGDGAIDHHLLASAGAANAHADQAEHVLRAGKASPDLPTFESIQMAAGGLAVTLVALVLFFIASRQERVWPRREVWNSHRVLPELPPPRLRGI